MNTDSKYAREAAAKLDSFNYCQNREIIQSAINAATADLRAEVERLARERDDAMLIALAVVSQKLRRTPIGSRWWCYEVGNYLLTGADGLPVLTDQLRAALAAKGE